MKVYNARDDGRLGGDGSRRSGSGTATSLDRKSTRLNSSHSQISYAVFCLKKKNTLYSSMTVLKTQIILTTRMRNGMTRPADTLLYNGDVLEGVFKPHGSSCHGPH